jgi:hypothetical protein
MVESETRHRTSADSVGMSVCDGANAGDELASSANLFGDDFAPPSATRALCIAGSAPT